MRFTSPPSLTRMHHFQKGLKFGLGIILLFLAALFFTQAGLELWARHGFVSSSGRVESIIRLQTASSNSAVRDFFFQNRGTMITYQCTQNGATYTGQDIVSNNRTQAVAAPTIQVGQERTLLVSSMDPTQSRLPRPFAYPFTLGLVFLAISTFLFWMRNDKTPHYYDPRAYQQQ